MGRPWIETWTPNDEGFWESRGKRVATRNLVFSIFAEHMGFLVWALWGATTAGMKQAEYGFSAGQLFGLVSIAGLVGALVRVPYTLAVPRFGGRNWTVVSALLLLVPVTMLALAFRFEAPYWFFYLAAATAGLGGGNFASSMANISFFYPDRKKGFALGLNAAGGNLGVAVAQLLVPALVTLGPIVAFGGTQVGPKGAVALQNAGLFFIPFIVGASLCAWLFMDNLRVVRSRPRDQLVILRRKHTWVMSWIYIGTFGSFIGFSGAFPLLIKTQFPDVVLAVAFLGPLVGSLSRPIGGCLADRIGGAKVTSAVFAGMGVSVLVALWVLSNKDAPWAFPAFFASFVVLFVLAGIGNGSTYRSIPAIFRAQAMLTSAEDSEVREAGLIRAQREAAAVLGLVGAVGALGGFLIPQTFAIAGSPQGAFPLFIAFYASCFLLNWWYYRRTSFAVARMPSTLAAADV